MPKELTRGQKIAVEAARARAQEKRLTQDDIAQLANVSSKTVWNLFNSETWPRNRSLEGIERALGWPVGHLTQLAMRYDEDVQALDDADPSERRLLELVQLLRVELDETQVSSHSQTVVRALKALTAQLIELGGASVRNVRPLKMRSLEEIDADLEREERHKADTLSSGGVGAQEVVRVIHDPRIALLQKERDLTRSYMQSGVAES